MKLEDRQPALEPAGEGALGRIFGRSAHEGSSLALEVRGGRRRAQPILIFVSVEESVVAALRDCSARGRCGCGPKCRRSSRGRGRTSRRIRPSWPSGMQPRCVQTPMTTSHSGFLTRLESASGSGRSASGDVFRRLDLLGRAMAHEDRLAAPFHGDDLPREMAERSTSVEASASVEASGFICAISGQTAAPAATVATAPVAMKRMSRRLGFCNSLVAHSGPFHNSSTPLGLSSCPPPPRKSSTRRARRF